MSLKLLYVFLLTIVSVLMVSVTQFSVATQTGNCSPAYPDVCIAPPPPDLDCKDVTYQNFRVNAPDPHYFDGDKDGIGCEAK